jgi:hypothetical protein
MKAPKIELHFLPPARSPTPTADHHLRRQLGLNPQQQLVLFAFKAIANGRQFYVGFGIGRRQGEGFGCSDTANAVVERLLLEARGPVTIIPFPGGEADPLPAVVASLRKRAVETPANSILMYCFADSEVLDSAVPALMRGEVAGVTVVADRRTYNEED